MCGGGGGGGREGDGSSARVYIRRAARSVSGHEDRARPERIELKRMRAAPPGPGGSPARAGAEKREGTRPQGPGPMTNAVRMRAAPSGEVAHPA